MKPFVLKVKLPGVAGSAPSTSGQQQSAAPHQAAVPAGQAGQQPRQPNGAQPAPGTVHPDGITAHAPMRVKMPKPPGGGPQAGTGAPQPKPAGGGFKIKIKGLKMGVGAGAGGGADITAEARTIAAQVAQQALQGGRTFSIKLPSRPTVALPTGAAAASLAQQRLPPAPPPPPARKPLKSSKQLARVDARAASRSASEAQRMAARAERARMATDRASAAREAKAAKRARLAYDPGSGFSARAASAGAHAFSGADAPDSPSQTDFGLPGSPMASEFTTSSGGGLLGGDAPTPQAKAPRAPKGAAAAPPKPPSVDEMLKVLEKIVIKDKRRVFANPVTEEEAPGYRDVVETPMDFTTIRTKLEAGGYTSWGALGADLELMFRNALAYNPDTNPIHVQAKGMLAITQKMIQLAESGVTNFRGRTAGITRRMNAELVRQERRQALEAEAEEKAVAGYEGRTRGVTVGYGEDGLVFEDGTPVPAQLPKRKYTKRRRLLLSKDVHRQIDQQVAAMTLEEGVRRTHKAPCAPEEVPAAAWGGLAGGANAQGAPFSIARPVLRLNAASAAALPADAYLRSASRFAARCGRRVQAALLQKLARLVPVPGMAPPAAVHALVGGGGGGAQLLQAGMTGAGYVGAGGGVRLAPMGLGGLTALQAGGLLQQTGQQQQQQHHHQQQQHQQLYWQQQHQQQQAQQQQALQQVQLLQAQQALAQQQHLQHQQQALLAAQHPT